MKLYTLTILCLFFLAKAYSTDTLSSGLNKKRLIIPAGTGIAAYSGSLIYLSEAWYKDDPVPFHLFNDLPQWKQMDKAGHLWTTFHEAKIASNWLIWSGLPADKSYVIGSISGFLLQVPLEILDGYSPEYGASIYDIVANGLGSLLLFSQFAIWNEIKIQPKFSFHRSGLANLRPGTLGKNLSEQILKDYNGQTYWLSGNIGELFNLKQKFPRWINIAVGYSASQMIFGRDEENLAAGFSPYRQYYLSFDIDFNQVKIKQKWLKVFLYPLNLIHIPFPAVEVSRKGFKLHPIYF